MRLFSRLSKLVSVVGVAAFVTPVFSSSAFAQQRSDSARILIQIQEMRQEISELRDMVERQSYELERLKRSQQNTIPQTYRPPAAPGSTTSNSEGVTQASDANQVMAIQDEGLTNSTSSQSQYNKAYRADQRFDEQPRAPINNSVNGQVVIAERQITAPPMSKGDLGNGNSFPPVEERPVGEQNPDATQRPELETELVVDDTHNASDGIVALPSTESQAVLDQGYRAATETQAETQAPEPKPSILSEQDYYQEGFALLKQSKHEQAINVFMVQINNYPKGDLADDAYYWIAESMYVNRELVTSRQYFKTIIDNFAQSPRLPDAMLKTAYIEQEQGNKIEARILLQEIIHYHPRSNAAISAKNRLDDLN